MVSHHKALPSDTNGGPSNGVFYPCLKDCIFYLVCLLISSQFSGVISSLIWILCVDEKKL